ncbi:DegT/DnrJ/EryC1/StrS aminotransferase family protein [Candidatus Pacearchaeota archaeon]|nr:DegT/DnrJ/EryC1/StrS aminotransferase family protein [Candidatus Pacearchaeota archaeon]
MRLHNLFIQIAIRREMGEKKIFLGIHYPKPVHLQEVTRKNTYVPILPITERVVSEIISLPMYPLLKNEKAEMIAEKIKEIIYNEQFR